MKKYRTAETILHGTGIGILDAVIIIRGIINNKDKSLSLNNYSYCKKIIELENISKRPQANHIKLIKQLVNLK